MEVKEFSAVILLEIVQKFVKGRLTLQQEQEVQAELSWLQQEQGDILKVVGEEKLRKGYKSVLSVC